MYRSLQSFFQALIIVFSFSILVACGDDSTPAPEPTIIGTWDQIGLEITDCADDEENGIQPVEDTSWTFNEDSTFTLRQEEFVRDGTFTTSGTNLTLTGDLIDEIPRTFTVTLTELMIIEDTQEDGCILNNSMTKRVD